MTDAYDEPAGIAARGTVLVAAGRGETAEIYARFGRRIAADGYRVRILPDVTADPGGSLAAAEKLLADDALPAPKVIVGPDAGALLALTLAARETPGLDALILAGLPVPRPAIDLLGWDAEIEARTACPNHRRVLGEGGASLQTDLPAELLGAGDVRLPTLGLHGDADPISPLGEARGRYPGTLVTIAGGRHDVLNDVSHRTVAATVVLFLERLRLGADLPAIAQVRRP
ncbi:lysophospholipase [Actinoplanes sp. KI2]|uniref:lysophospholipase n=1 Tax=Actinoplanes sp. KI2 TaxID=2983315 RepID=UPI0021D6009F|nr:lysophospholipase [Actinoplanes sp. KI2]MCU7722432.1 lysophospholipase [Actinoplanes sp. KI2]